MVNPSGDQFFIFAEPLINVCDNPTGFVRIKRKDKKLKRYSDHHQGEIFGASREISSENKSFTKITLYFGAVDSLIKYNSDRSDLLETVDVQDYYFPKTEFLHFIKSIKAMISQHSQFTLHLMNTEVLAASAE